MTDLDDLKAENARLQALVEEMQAALLEGMRRLQDHCADHEWTSEGVCDHCGKTASP